MFKSLFSRVSSAVSRLDAVASKLLNSLYRLYDRLTAKLDLALSKLDEITRNLLRKYYRALDYLEKLFRILQKLVRVLFPILLLFVPPTIGFVIAFMRYETKVLDSIVLAVMSLVLLLVLLASFRSTEKLDTLESGVEQASLTLVPELDNFSVVRKVVGALLAAIVLAASAYLNIGLFLGFLVFAGEVAVMYVLKGLYGTRATRPMPATE